MLKHYVFAEHQATCELLAIQYETFMEVTCWRKISRHICKVHTLVQSKLSLLSFFLQVPLRFRPLFCGSWQVPSEIAG